MFKLVATLAAAICASAAFAQAPAPAPSGLQLTAVDYVIPADPYYRRDRYRFEREHGYFRHRDASYARWMHERQLRHERYARYWRHHDRYAHFEHRHYRRYVG